MANPAQAFPVCRHGIELFVRYSKKEPVVEVKCLRFVDSKIWAGGEFRSKASGEVRYDAAVTLLSASEATLLDAPDASRYNVYKRPSPNVTSANKRTARPGASEFQGSGHASVWPTGPAPAPANSRVLSLGAGRRGFQERN
jgi:hypothetical protein